MIMFTLRMIKLVGADKVFPVFHSNWASPVVHVPNARLDDWCKLPNVKDMFAMLSQDGCQRDTRQNNNLSLPKYLTVSVVH